MKALVLTFAVAFFAVTAGGARAYHNFWANCNYATAQPNYSLTRDGAQTYSYTAAYEGYHWGGGCWNNNDVDEGWGDPPMDISTHGEGADCSGLVFKTWKESENTSDGGKYYWNPLRNVHGPYTAASFRDGAGAPNGLISKAYAGAATAGRWRSGAPTGGSSTRASRSAPGSTAVAGALRRPGPSSPADSA